MDTSITPFDTTAIAVLSKINDRTPEHSIHRNFAAAHIAKSSSHDWIGLEGIADEQNVEYKPDNADILAVAIIIPHNEQFEDLRNFDDMSIKGNLEHLGVEYDEKAPEFTGEGEYDTSLPENRSLN